MSYHVAASFPLRLIARHVIECMTCRTTSSSRTCEVSKQPQYHDRQCKEKHNYPHADLEKRVDVVLLLKPSLPPPSYRAGDGGVSRGKRHLTGISVQET